MALQDATPARPSNGSAELYVIGAEAQQTYVQTRRARDWVPSFLPHLRPGMRLLDCGCGVGSITLDLAEIVAPGPVVGVDVDPAQLEVARESARRRGLDNVSLQTASVYDLPFPDASFDAALAHTLLMHLSDPPAALREMRRVLKPGGVVGVADDDYGTIVQSPTSPLLDQIRDVWTRFVVHSGGSPFYSRHLRRYLLEAGFARTEGHAVAAEHYGTPEETRRFGQFMAGLFRQPAFVEAVTTQGWVDRETLEAMANEYVAWGERPDAFVAWMYCAAVGWVADATGPGGPAPVR